jgi:pimeloyl-ACP methyl ester carboxylesterase
MLRYFLRQTPSKDEEVVSMVAFLAWIVLAVVLDIPAPPGRLVDVGGHRLHMNCSGQGGPTVVVETGLGDFSFDWILVQRRVESFTRICTYDRGGYAWSEPGPLPRTFDQLNVELRQALKAAGERGPYVLVGHSFGGGIVRHHALRHPSEVAGLVFVDIVAEHQYIRMGPHAGRVGDDAKGREIPQPKTGGAQRTQTFVDASSPVATPHDRLPPNEQRLHGWAAAQPTLNEVENSQREWSAEYFARWVAAPQKSSLGNIPLIVLTRAEGGYGKNLDKPEDELERARLEAQRSLAELSTRGSQQVVNAGHNMHLEAPDVVTQAIRDLISQLRRR